MGMKRFVILIVIVGLTIGCSTDEPVPAGCNPTVIEEFDEASTFFYFDENSGGNSLLSSISVYDGTDSSYSYSYTYDDALLASISSMRDGFNTTFTAALDGDMLTTLSGRQTGSGIVSEEIRFTYSGGFVNTVNYYAADINTGDLYQYLHYDYDYNNNDLISVKYYVDLNMLFTLAFGSTPTEPYNPELIFQNEFTYGGSPAPNPMYGQFNMYNPDLSYFVNVPIALVQKDADGNLTGSLGYTLSFNEQGYPILADASSSFIDFTYNCN